jgi:hypothetical protein
MLVFDPIRHVYKNAHTNEEYISVTTLLNRYKKPFDVKSASERVAKREGTTPEEIQALWKKINSESKTYGTRIHNIIEQYNKEKRYDKENQDLIDSYNTLGVLTEKDNLLSEQQLYSNIDKIAGTADIIRLNGDSAFDVFDIKTNKRLNFYSPYKEKLLHPLSHLDACEYTTYGLQLSFYAYMYHSMTGKNLQQLGIFYYNREENKFYYYPVPYMKSDIIRILQAYEQSQLG